MQSAFDKFCDLISRRGDIPGGNITLSVEHAKELREFVVGLLAEKHAGEFELFDLVEKREATEGQMAPLHFARLARAGT
jgi:hypothetical protein